MTCLRSQVESKITASRQTILNQQRNFVREAELDSLGQASSFAEVDKVFEREGQGDRLSELDLDVQFWLVDVGVAS